ncbi:MAG: diguanylate cyclase [Solirubrobacterales bacterium]|nr:diguanylate cyclase [Solirubrobacterales bacterium]
METRGSAPLDATNVRFRMRSIQAGAWLTVGTVTVFSLYAVLTWAEPHRAAMLATTLATGTLSLFLPVLPMERVIRSRWREPFFIAWSVAVIAIITVMAALDGGIDSPIPYALAIPLAFGSLSYPLWSMVLVGVLVQASAGTIIWLDTDVQPAYAYFVCSALGLTTWMCSWQARSHDRLHGELGRVSRADPLTGCLNRRGFEERLGAELSRASRSGRPLALILLDLDGFKEINDSRGHAAGDALLRWTVATIERTLRPADALGRIGGDEFAVVLPDAGRAEAVEIAERLRQVLADQSPASLGVASFPTDGTTAEQLHQQADAELYAVKRGRKGGRITGPPQELSWAAAMARAVDLRMAGQHDHSQAVGDYAVLIGERLGFDGDALGRLRLAGMLHDVGKAAVPDAILRKPGALDDDERAVIHEHPAAGAEMVARIEGLEPLAGWVRASHEHLDGSGYPDGLRGEEIPLPSRILLVADAYDAMTSDRVYRRALSHDDAVAELRRHAGTQFDADCVEHLIAALAEQQAAHARR